MKGVVAILMDQAFGKTAEKIESNLDGTQLVSTTRQMASERNPMFECQFLKELEGSGKSDSEGM